MNPSMSNFDAFHSQLLSVTEILAKAAMAEINRCVGDSCAVFRLEITESQREIETLKHKLQVLEREFIKTRRKKTDRVIEQEWSFRPGQGEEPTNVEEVESHLQLSIMGNQLKNEPPPIERMGLEEDFGCSVRAEMVTQPTHVEDEKKPDTESTPVGDPEELREQHICGHGDEELSGLEFVVKAEQEEEHVAQRLNQTESKFGAGRLNNLGSEYVMFERDDQLWTSFPKGSSDIESDDPVCSNATEQCSQILSIHSPQYHTPATMEVSANTLSFFGVSCSVRFDKMGEKPSVCSEELRSEAIHTQQGQYIERLRHTVERENQTLLPQQQQHGPSVKHRRGSESPAQPRSGSPHETGSTLSTGAVKTGKKRKTRRRPGLRERLFSCTQSVLRPAMSWQISQLTYGILTAVLHLIFVSSSE
ncbi:hypothetical protein GJAV_G00093860 [Gymnothorax javanicus]|nr:hypothetical protein GJAV_G00093860 [Gymnothorax javanicus]